MAVKVFGFKKRKLRIGKVICPKCRARLIYTFGDVEFTQSKDISGYSDSYDYVNCPNCKQRVVINQY